MVPEEKLLEVEIEPGMRDGQEYSFVSEGEDENRPLPPIEDPCIFPVLLASQTGSSIRVVDGNNASLQGVGSLESMFLQKCDQIGVVVFGIIEATVCYTS